MNKTNYATKIKLNSFDDLFDVNDPISGGATEIKEIPLAELHEFKGHEVLLVPESFTQEAEDLASMVYEINRAVVNEMDFLSDTIYHYDAETRTLTMVNPPESLAKDLEESRSEEPDLEEDAPDLDDPPFKVGR